MLESAYLAAGDGPGGAGCGYDAEGWHAARAPLLAAVARSGPWLDVGCANGHLLETLPAWARERGHDLEPHGLELIPRVADLARRRLPTLAARIYTGDVMSWTPPRRFTLVTALADCVPPERIAKLVHRLRERVVSPGGRMVISAYGGRRKPAPPIAEVLVAHGVEPAGSARALLDGVVVTESAWLDVPEAA